MNIVFKIMIYSVVLNFAVGIMGLAIPAFVEEGNAGGLVYDETFAEGFTVMEDSVNPDSGLEDRGNQIYRLLDSINLGFIARFISIIPDLMYGAINLFQSIFGGFMEPALSNLIFGTLKVLITIGYILGGLFLWTGRKLNE